MPILTAQALESILLKRPPQIDLGEYLPYLVNRFGAALVEWFSDRALRERGVSIAMWRVLAALVHDDNQRLTDLSDVTSIEISTLSKLVTRLVALGYVKRSRSSTDSREVSVALTTKGRGVASEIVPIALDLEETAIAGISDKDIAVVKRTLIKMHKNLVDRD